MSRFNSINRPDLVFDIETVPDVDLCRTVYGTPEMDDASAVRAALEALGRDPETGILPEAFQRPIVVASCLLDYVNRQVKPAIFIEGRPKYPNEERILMAFWNLIEASQPREYAPRLVSFNGKAFDMRVLEVRSLKYETIGCAAYFQPAGRNANYRYKYSDEEHLDLLDYLPNYGNKTGFGLRTIAALLGLPGKDQLDGSQVYPVYQAGGIMQIAAYCLEDVIQTALIKLRLDRLRGLLTRDELHERMNWFLDAMERYLADRAAPEHAAFEHTLAELKQRYRPAMLASMS